ncbi:MAG: rhomboid family intramembrane serine protease [Chloroflexi bacterium]|nr:MAG: rhomboid family intramembrane serine protease [Chloroflexota bacterium]
MENIYTENNTASRTMRSQMSYQKALSQYRSVHGLSRISWVTWGVVTGTIIIWCVTAFSSVLIAFGAKDNDLILQGQYWRFGTPIFLHANLLHLGLNMLNLAVLGVFLERLVGHMRFLLIYVTTGIVSIIASFYFMPQEISVGASGAIFGLVGAYSVFVLMHRRAFRKGGIPALLWLIIVIAGNLSIGFFVPNVDNYAHLGGLLSGCLLGWWFTPLYTLTQDNTLIDKHSLSRRWPLALLTIAGTLILAIIARLFIGG